ncbi:MAG TPA: hypothetical protein VLW53_16640 [Candidatus Eisenbacteria bacterium]|nr:hypothetical protein [Candidatus Eisenbacteria bacterium]
MLWQVRRQRRGYRLSSRWRLLIDLLRRAWLLRRSAVEWDAAAPLSRRAAFGIGILHGTAARPGANGGVGLSWRRARGLPAAPLLAWVLG